MTVSVSEFEVMECKQSSSNNVYPHGVYLFGQIYISISFIFYVQTRVAFGCLKHHSKITC